MTSLEKTLTYVVLALIGSGVFAGWWALHNRHEQSIGATACLQATTVTKTEAKEEVKQTEAAQAVDINAVVKGYEFKVLALARSNDDIAGRLSDSLRQNRVPHSGSAACANAADPGLPKGQSEAAERSARIRADIKLVLDACDANQVKTEDAAAIYNGVRDRALSAAK